MLCSLKDARIEIGLSQEKLAYKLGVSRETIRTIESGDTIPNVLLAMRIANEVGKDLKDLFKDLH